MNSTANIITHWLANNLDQLVSKCRFILQLIIEVYTKNVINNEIPFSPYSSYLYKRHVSYSFINSSPYFFNLFCQGNNDVEAIVVAFKEGTRISSFGDLWNVKKLRLLYISGEYECSPQRDETKLEHLRKDLQFLKRQRFSSNNFSSSLQPRTLFTWNPFNTFMEQLSNNHAKEVTFFFFFFLRQNIWTLFYTPIQKEKRK